MAEQKDLLKERLKKAYNAFDPKKVIDENNPFYVDYKMVRGEFGDSIVDSLLNRIELTDDDTYFHGLFSGHVGSGKSTEILNLKLKLENDGYTVIYLNAGDEFDLNNLMPTDLLFMIAKNVYENHKDKVSEALWNLVTRWFGEVLYESSEKKDYQAKVSAGMDGGPEIPFLGKLFFKISGHLSKGGTERESFRLNLKKNISQLLGHVNNILEELKDNRSKGTVLIIDEMEKMNRYTRVNEDSQDIHLYVNNANLWESLHTHFIFTIPIFLLNSKSRTTLERNFEIYELPVIKVKEKNGDSFPDGLNFFKDVVTKRLAPHFNIEEIIPQNLLDKAVLFSGGQLKYFIKVIRDLIFRAIQSKTLPVDRAQFDIVKRGEIRSLDNAVYDDLFGRLKRVSENKSIQRTEEDLKDFEMLNQGWILAYANGQWWYDVLPVIKELERFKNQPSSNGPK